MAIKCRHCKKTTETRLDKIAIICIFKRYGIAKIHYIIPCDRCNRYNKVKLSDKIKSKVDKNVLIRRNFYIVSHACKCKQDWDQRKILLDDVSHALGGRIYMCPACVHKRKFQRKNIPKPLRDLVTK